MKRFLFTFFASASLILCVAVSVIWVRSYRVANEANIRWNRAAHHEGFSFNLRISRGGISLECNSLPLSHPIDFARYFCSDNLKDSHRANWASEEATEYPAGQDHEKIVAGFGLFHETERMQNGLRRQVHCVVPLWSLVSFFGLLPAAWLVLAWRRRHRGHRLVGHCVCCGYDLRASPDICPECGSSSRLTRLDKTGVARLRRRTLLAAGMGAAFFFHVWFSC